MYITIYKLYYINKNSITNSNKIIGITTSIKNKTIKRNSN